MTNKDYASLFKALSDETRLKIVAFLKSGKEHCACKILETLTIKQPTLSYHMKILLEARLIHARKQGTWMWYTLDKSVFKQAGQFFNSK